MFHRTRITSYEEFQRDLFADRGRALSAREQELFDDPPPTLVRALDHGAPRRRAPLPRWRPPALASDTPYVASLEFEVTEPLRSVS